MSKEDKISIISLGGSGEIGNNMIVIENEDDIIVLDAGNLFPEPDDYGIDLIIPDISYLYKNKDKIRGLIFSHGHEDHIGAIPYLLKDINPPLYGTDLTIGLIKNKLEDAGLINTADLNIIKEDDNLKLNSFEIEFCHVNHSIPASVAIAIKSPAGTIVYTGDYKFDQTPINNPQTDYQKLADWGKEGVLALLGDSTNVEREGHTLSERVVAKTLEESFRLTSGRIIIATFASNIHRIQQIIKAGVKDGRKIAISGYSLEKTIELAAKLGYLDITKGMLVTLDEAKKMNPSKVILLMTGSQGEYRASLTRMARGEHRDISLKPGDTVFLSSHPIPGNEKAIGETINLLYKQGAVVIDNDMLDLHASGHAQQEEIKMMINLTKPKYLIPVHGEYRHLHHHAQLGKDMGIPVENIFIAVNGEVVEISKKKAELKGQIEAGKKYIEGNKVHETGKKILKERKKMVESGFVNIIIPVNHKGEYSNIPTMISRGGPPNNKIIIKEIKKKIHKYLQELQGNNVTDIKIIKKKLYTQIRNYFLTKTNGSPMINIAFVKIEQ